MTEDEDRLWRILGARDTRAVRSRDLAGMYRGGLYALEDRQRSDHIAQSAHSLRELMEKLPLSSGLEVGSSGYEASDVLTGTLKLLAKAREESAAFQIASNEWKGAVDAPLSDVLKALSDAEARGSRGENARGRARAFITAEAEWGEPRSPERREQLVVEWMSLHKQLKDISHHRTSPSVDAYSATVQSTTALLLEILRATPSERLEIFDKLIDEAEADAN